MPLSSLPRAQLHHDQIKAGSLPVRGRVGDHVLIHQQFAVPGFHGRHKIREDLAAEVVGPVMQDRVQIIGPSCLHRLFGEEVVGCDLYRGMQILDGRYDLREVLEHEAASSNNWLSISVTRTSAQQWRMITTRGVSRAYTSDLAVSRNFNLA